jgi:hypothetical protein
MTRLSWFLAVVSSTAFVSISTRGMADPQGEAQPSREAQPSLTWHATPPGSPAATSSDEPEKSRAPKDDAATATGDGRLLPFTVGAAMPKAHADVTALGGYDSAAREGRALSGAEAKVLPFLALRVDYEHGPATGSNDQVTFGGRVQILNQAKQGVDFGAGFFYKAKDFRGEGDFLGSLMLGRNFGRWGVFANGLAGIDSEGDDWTTEVRLSTLYRATKELHVGFDARARYNFSDDEKRTSAQQLNWEMQAGPLASMALGPVALLAIVGPSALHLTEPGGATGRTTVGALAMAGAGAAF